MAVANDFATDSLFGGGPDGSPRELFAKMGLHLDPRTGGTSPEDARSIDMAMASIDAGIDNLFAGVPSMASLDEDAPADAARPAAEREDAAAPPARPDPGEAAPARPETDDGAAISDAAAPAALPTPTSDPFEVLARATRGQRLAPPKPAPPAPPPAPPAARKAARQRLFCACSAGDVAGIDAALASGAVAVDDVVHALSKARPVHAAVRRPAALRALLGRHGARVDARRGDGSTALCDAADNGLPVESVKLLLDEFGADVNARDRDGHTPLDLALAADHALVAGIIKDRGGLRGGAKDAEKIVAEATAQFSALDGLEGTKTGARLEELAAKRAAAAPPEERKKPAAAAAAEERKLAAAAAADGDDFAPPPAAKVQLCERCAGPAKTRCSRCQKAWYCGEACQRAAWATHRDLCRRAPKKRSSG